MRQMITVILNPQAPHVRTSSSCSYQTTRSKTFKPSLSFQNQNICKNQISEITPWLRSSTPTIKKCCKLSFKSKFKNIEVINSRDAEGNLREFCDDVQDEDDEEEDEYYQDDFEEEPIEEENEPSDDKLEKSSQKKKSN